MSESLTSRVHVGGEGETVLEGGGGLERCVCMCMCGCVWGGGCAWVYVYVCV